MPMLLNIHTPTHSFALPFRQGESTAALLERIARKAGVPKGDAVEAIKEGRDGAGLRYEFDGGRWTLADDDDLEILLQRFNPSTTSHITLHLASPYLSTQTSAPSNGLYKALAPSPQPANGSTPSLYVPAAPTTAASQHQAHASHHHLNPRDFVARSARSIKSTISRRSVSKQSVHPGTGAIVDVPQSMEGQESAGDKHKRLWKEFHAGNGVRTVVGKVGNVDNVRMLLKQGYRHVYVSRPFALKHGLIPKTSGMGTYGYAGLVNLGSIPITVGSKTASHPVMLSEETNFDCVLGRSWMEKMGIKTDPLDQTSVVYMDTGERIPCDVVVLKDAKGEVITVT
ncbi:hypothetical protein NliqN6_5376 [Naganishia liquefaciens]|uniref:Uncharacterized protein n=1 Tax=Naganishia liquefaciens TaxID=104408 RepID=A0A8H3YGP1_9TREE|nr:hypothetical protein NliqN6_5376 [Naganishia liquefaciens]